MPASKDGLTEAEIEQRQEAAVKHGVYRRDLQVADQGLETRGEVVQALRLRALRAVEACNVVTGYVARRAKEGVDLDKIAVLRALPAFQNSAQRALKDLFDVLPDDDQVIDAATVLRDLREKYRGEDDNDK